MQRFPVVMNDRNGRGKVCRQKQAGRGGGHGVLYLIASLIVSSVIILSCSDQSFDVVMAGRDVDDEDIEDIVVDTLTRKKKK